MGKNFDFEILGPKYVLEHSESILTKTIFCSTFFDFVIFSLFWPKNERVLVKNLFCSKNDRGPGKSFRLEKIVDFEIFGLNCVLKHSESISTKKRFDQFFYQVIFRYFDHFDRKTIEPQGKNFTQEKIFDYEIFWLKIGFETF